MVVVVVVVVVGVGKDHRIRLIEGTSITIQSRLGIMSILARGASSRPRRLETMSRLGRTASLYVFFSSIRLITLSRQLITISVLMKKGRLRFGSVGQVYDHQGLRKDSGQYDPARKYRRTCSFPLRWLTR